MGDERSRVAYFEPDWFRDETRRLSQKWIESKSDLDVVDYILKNASPEYLKMYDEEKKAFERAS